MGRRTRRLTSASSDRSAPPELASRSARVILGGGRPPSQNNNKRQRIQEAAEIKEKHQAKEIGGPLTFADGATCASACRWSHHPSTAASFELQKRPEYLPRHKRPCAPASRLTGDHHRLSLTRATASKPSPSPLGPRSTREPWNARWLATVKTSAPEERDPAPTQEQVLLGEAAPDSPTSASRR